MEASGPRVGPSGGVQSGGPWELKEVGVCGQSGSFLIQPSLMASHASGSFLPVLDLHLGSGHVSEESNPVAQQGAQITTRQIDRVRVVNAAFSPQPAKRSCPHSYRATLQDWWSCTQGFPSPHTGGIWDICGSSLLWSPIFCLPAYQGDLPGM